MARASAIIGERALLNAYRDGIFPMAETRDSEDVFWVDPRLRGILPLDGFHLPKRLARTMRSSAFLVSVDTAFEKVIAACAETAAKRDNTWINPVIERSYCNLFAKGHAHSVEIWDETTLVGGLYGVSIGAVFFGESMFSRQTDASKMALVNLVARLRAGQYQLLDTQFITEHLKQFGTVEISRARYRTLLAKAVAAKSNFYELGGAGAFGCVGAVLQLTTQTS
jgi:leucyl/phenylalanyl-tRNA--protein transferase